MSRSGPELVLPPVPYLPGRTPRPPEHLFEPLKRELSPALTARDLASSIAFRCGLEAFFAGYYWEAHELWEAVWMCLPPASAERHFVRGLIQLANAGLKRRMRRPAAARRILALADAAFSEAAPSGSKAVMTIDVELLSKMRQQAENGSGSITAK